MSRQPKPHVCAPHLLPGECLECLDNTPASPPVQEGERCPDCGREKASDTRPTTPGCKRGLLDKTGRQHQSLCAELTITRLRQELATVRASHDALEAGRAHLEEAARILATIPDTVTMGVNGGAEWPAHCAWLASRAKGGG